MKKGFTLAVLFFLTAIGALAPEAFALEVDRNELGTANAASIEFINYNGPHSVVSTAAEITGIGTALGSSLLAAGVSGDGTRYRIIHAVDPAVATGLDADILVLGANAGVDHIDNIRRILAGYLTAAYGYSAKDANTLAVFVTVYNAVNRGKLEALSKKYKPVVMGYVTSDKVGLSLRYDEWAGRSQIIVPLSEARLTGTVSTIDTTSLTAPEVVGKIKEDANAGVDTRKDMVDLKEREADAAQNRAETAQKDAAAARTDAQAAQSDLAAAKTDAQAAQKAADQAAKTAAANPQDEAAQQKAAETAAAAAEKKQDVAEKQQAADQANAAVAENERQAAADQKLADTKNTEAQAERKDIATDVQKQVDQNAAAAKAAEKNALAETVPAYALRIVDEKNLLAELQLVDLNSGKLLKTSPLNSIRNRTLVDTGAGLMAVAGKKGGNATVKLVLVDSSSLELIKEGADSIAESSMLVRLNNDYFAVVETDSGAALGRFDGNLAIKAKSTVNVLPSTVITATDKGILVQDSKGLIRLLRSTDLVDLAGK